MLWSKASDVWSLNQTALTIDDDRKEKKEEIVKEEEENNKKENVETHYEERDTNYKKGKKDWSDK